MGTKTIGFNREYATAKSRGKRLSAREPRAVSAHYDHHTRRMVVELQNGVTLAFPVDLAQGLRGALPKQLEAVEITPSGYGLHWEQLDADLSVPALAQGILGTKAWVRELARYAGSRTSAKKAAAARRNGKKGGRPRLLVTTRAGAGQRPG
ncbi:MAG TPA: DUF2442 domain-containing protein [Nevskiales bacterium]|nr:DUF2442 domain-containing protein [Nevskiales bacterium]